MASICDLNNKKAKIDYPTHWEYKIIFDADVNVEEKVKEIVKDREFKLVFSKFSKDKKYASYDLAVLVLSEEESLEIFSALKHEAKYVL